MLARVHQHLTTGSGYKTTLDSTVRTLFVQRYELLHTLMIIFVLYVNNHFS